MACGSVSNAAYLVDNARVGCCFVYCVDCRGRNMVPACRDCHSVFPDSPPRRCARCNVYSFSDVRHYGNCGLQREACSGGDGAPKHP